MVKHTPQPKGVTTMATTAKATPAATFTKPEKVQPKYLKGTSTVDNPVGVTWVACINATAANNGTPPKRSALTKQVMALGVTYYTARTQVNRYLQWFGNGSPQGQLPRGVVVNG